VKNINTWTMRTCAPGST